MKKKRLFVCIAIAFTVILFVGYHAYVYSRYAYTLKLNWDIEFPVLGYKEIYSIDSGSSFHGDGIRYHIFRYPDSEDLEDVVAWTTEEGQNRFGKSYQAVTEEWLDELNVPKDYRPDYETSFYYYDIQKDNSEIIIYFNALEAKICVVEYFL